MSTAMNSGCRQNEFGRSAPGSTPPVPDTGPSRVAVSAASPMPATSSQISRCAGIQSIAAPATNMPARNASDPHSRTGP